MAEREVFLMKRRHQYYLSQRGERIYGAQSLKERRLLYESMFIQTERWTLILKMVPREVFLIKPKHQDHLPQWGGWICGAQSLGERRLICESVFIQWKNEL